MRHCLWVTALCSSLLGNSYIGRINSMCQTTAWNLRVHVMWLYHPAEVESMAGGDIKREWALFSSSHCEENDLQTISPKCQVLQFEDFTRLVHSGRLDKDMEVENNDTWYLAGEYHPLEGIIKFETGDMWRKKKIKSQWKLITYIWSNHKTMENKYIYNIQQ